MALRSMKSEDLSQQDIPEVFRMQPLRSLDLYEITVEALQSHMSSGKLTSIDYVTYCLDRIHSVSRRSPTIDEV